MRFALSAFGFLPFVFVSDFVLRVSDFRFARCYQFERLGYFSIDPDSDLDLSAEALAKAEPPVPSQRKLVFNRTITLKDTWAKESKKVRSEE